MISRPQRGWPSDEYRWVCLWGFAVWSQTSDGLQIALGMRQFGSCHSRGRYLCAIIMWFVSRVCPYRHLATPMAGGGGSEYHGVCLLGLALLVSYHHRGGWGGPNSDGFVSWSCPDWPLSQSWGMEGLISSYLSLGLAQFEL